MRAMLRAGRAVARWPLLWPVVPAALCVHRLPVLPAGGWIAALAIAGVVALVLRPRAGRMAGVAALTAAFCLWRAAGALDDRVAPELEGIDLRVTGHVASMPVAGSYGARLRFRVDSCRHAGGDGSACRPGRQIDLRWHGGTREPMPEPGSRWSLTVRVKRPHAVLNAGGYDAELAALAGGVAARGYVRAKGNGVRPPERLDGNAPGVGLAFERARTWTRARLVAVLAPYDADAAGTIVALVVGDQAAIPPTLWQVYQATGVGHLMSISGLHITMLAAIALWACRRLLARAAPRFPTFFQRWPAPLVAWWPALAIAFAYSVFSGWGIPAQRTCWMLAAAGAAMATGRAGRIGEVLALTAAVVVASDPWSPLSAGFWLSFAAVGAIVLHGGSAGARPSRWAQAVGTQWAATVAMLPLGAVFFSSFSLIGPVANAVAIPVVSALVTPLALAGTALSALSAELGGWALWPVALATEALIAMLEPMAAASGSTAVIATPGFAALVASGVGTFCLLAPTRPIARRQACVLMLPLLVGTDNRPPPGHWRLTAIDVGQGNAVLVETHRHRLLYDAGPSYGPGSDAGLRHVLPSLRSRGIDRLDRLIVSHEDDDHAGGAMSVVDAIPVGSLLGSLGPGHPVARVSGFAPCARGHRWHWDDVEFELLHPGPARLAARVPKARRAVYGGNGSSCVLRIRSTAGSALLAGDIEADDERELLQVYGDAGLRSDVLVVPHHGSGTSSTPLFVAAVAPRVALVQVGYRNRFRHPKDSVVARYRARGVEIARSDADAAIRVDFVPGRPPLVSRWRREDKRYWRIEVDPEP